MGMIWLACCEAADIARLKQELAARDERPRILRVGDVGALEAMPRALPGEEANAALFIHGAEVDEAIEAVGDIARSGCAGEILVFADGVGAGEIARLFYAGATEVIAADEADAAADAELACMGGELVGAGAQAPPARDDASARADASDACMELEEPDEPEAPARPAGAGPRAPVVTVLSGRGGVGKTAIAAMLGALASSWGMRAALIDLDLMFGDLHAWYGVDEPADLGKLYDLRGGPGGFEAAVESSATKIGPGLTLWGPLQAPERAELVAGCVERLVALLQGVADIVIVDTSAHWGDAVASTVARSDRCLVVGGATLDAGRTAARVVELVAKMGVPHTRMTAVFNRLGAHGHGEDAALRFEMGAALRSKHRVSDGGDEVAMIGSVAQLVELLQGDGAYARSSRELASRLFRELGCTFEEPAAPPRAAADDRPRIRLPWK